ncbi:MAG TPA: transcriptional repressor [Desulfobaccales bacterium]|jgi:Fe2+ or Zn2+ uptake regulation protein|nr:transcriptional repressor [Desulfobaccales bacterium]
MENLVQRLRNCGIAVTPQRLAVMASLQNRRDHPSAEHIYQEVRRQLPTISFNTVYKALEVLCQKGMVMKVNPLHEVARYDGVTAPHAHLICRQCHHIIDLEWEAGAFPELAPAEQHGFQLDHPSLIFWGLCPHCQGQKFSQED